jgi:hypothetical protein
MKNAFFRWQVGSSILSTGTISWHSAGSVIRSGTNPRLSRFLRMKIREENCNMFLLAIVTVLTVVVAASASLVAPADKAPVRIAARAEQALAADKPIVHVTEQPAVRVVGAPFVPNTNPRER